MARMAATSQVHARNNLGQFIRECEQAAGRTVNEMVDEGAKLSRARAPRGHKHDPRTIPLADSIDSEMLSRTSGRWFATARHAMAIEKGARPHLIPGSPFLKFFWESAGRMWVPGLYGPQDIVNHPGNDPQPYLEPAFHLVVGRFGQIASKFYPG